MEVRAKFLTDYAEGHGPVTVRQLYYQAVVAGLPGIEKTESGYFKVQRQALDLRRSGDLAYKHIADAEKGYQPIRERMPANYGIGAAQFVRALLPSAAVGAIGVVVARRPIGIADLAWTDYKVMAAKSTAAVGAHAETTAVEIVFQGTTVGSTSIKALALASSKPAATMSQRFVAGEHQSASNQHGNRQFFRHDVPLLLQG